MLGAILAAMVAWTALEFPRVAFFSEVAEVKEFSEGTRTLVLLQQKKSASQELEVIESRILDKPRDRDLLSRKVDLKLELDIINIQLQALAEKE